MDPVLDIHILANLVGDTLDYCGDGFQQGSKLLLLASDSPDRPRHLPQHFTGELPYPFTGVSTFCSGCLVISGPCFSDLPNLGEDLAGAAFCRDWPLVILCDDAESTAATETSFLWRVFTRFDPVRDLHFRICRAERNRFYRELPVVIDARQKPGYPEPCVPDPVVAQKVAERYERIFSRISG